MATKPKMRFISTTSDKLDSISISAGQLIFVSDKRALYLDTDKRTSYQAIISVVDEETRENLNLPVEGYYYVLSDNVLYSYFNSTWAKITGSQDSSVVFADEDLPEEGDSSKLYVNDTTLYRWDSTTNSYTQITSKVEWEQLN